MMYINDMLQGPRASVSDLALVDTKYQNEIVMLQKKCMEGKITQAEYEVLIAKKTEAVALIREAEQQLLDLPAGTLVSKMHHAGV